MFCDHVNSVPEGELMSLPDGAVMCPACARRCRGCGTVTRVEELDVVEGLCGACWAGEPLPLTARALLASGLVGMWKDREDIEDPVKFAKMLRRRAEKGEKDI